MNDMDAVIGREVIRSYSGRRDTMDGPELTGISTSTWVYAPLIVELTGAMWLSVSPGECAVLDALPSEVYPELFEFSDDDESVPYGRRIVDVVTPQDQEPEVMILLTGGYFLTHYFLPGGSRYSFKKAEPHMEVTSVVTRASYRWP